MKKPSEEHDIMKTRFSKRQVTTLASTAILPLVSLAVAYWGSTWGWNVDKKLQQLVGYYLLAAYAMVLLPHFLILVPEARLFGEGLAKRVGRKGFLHLIWGVQIAGVAVVLINLFDSNALWLGSMAVFYVGFFIAMFSVVRMI